jgi:geranylgeranyl diphosphate synthase type I
MGAVTDAVYNLIKDLLPQDEASWGYRDALAALIYAAHAKEKKSLSMTNLAVLCCQAAGGDAHRAIPLAAAWRLLHIAAQVLDNIEDKESDCTLGTPLDVPQALNATTGLIFTAQRALSSLPRSGVSATLALAILDDFGSVILRMCAGQHADLAVQNAVRPSLEQYQTIIATKSGDFFALPCRVGAMLGIEDAQQVARYAEFGYNLGVLVQISDDLTDLRVSGQQSDLASGRSTLPILYALSIASPTQQAVMKELLLRAPNDAEAEAEARQMIIALGAPTYLLVKAQVHRRRAEQALRTTCRFGPAHDQLLALVSQVMPASSLIHSAGGFEGDPFPSLDDEDGKLASSAPSSLCTNHLDPDCDRIPVCQGSPL